MFDDTCYLLGFDKIEFAVYTLILLNSDTVKQFLKSIIFADAKRTFTKDVLMRIDILGLAKKTDTDYLKSALDEFNTKFDFKLTLNLWDDFIEEMMPQHHRQTELFV